MEDLVKNLSLPTLDMSVDRYAAFRSWKERWRDFVLLAELDKKDPAIHAAMLRYTFSEDTRNVYESWNLSEEDKKNPTVIMAMMEEFAKGIVNETLERHKFFQRQQEEGESFDDFLTDVKLLSKNCNFCNTAECYESLLRDRIVNGVISDKVREKLLTIKKLTLEKAIEICRSSEKAIDGVSTLKKSLTEPEESVARVNTRRYKYQSQQGKRDTVYNICKFCTRRHQFAGRESCPAWGKKCRECGNNNHFAKSTVCPSSKNKSNNGERDAEEHLGAPFLGSVEVGSTGHQNKDKAGGDENL